MDNIPIYEEKSTTLFEISAYFLMIWGIAGWAHNTAITNTQEGYIFSPLPESFIKTTAKNRTKKKAMAPKIKKEQEIRNFATIIYLIFCF